MIFSSLIILQFVAVSLASSSNSNCVTHATILRQLEREGFHLEIHSLVELVVDVETASLWENCTLLLRENISDAFYVSPDQLSDLSRTGSVRACTNEEVDIEAPQHLSKHHLVYIYSKFQRSQNLIYSHVKFPLHMRYHSPKIDGGYSAAFIKAPSLLMQCDSLLHCDNLTRSKAPCDMCGDESCQWMRFPYKTNAHNFTLPVPVGNLKHLPFVAVFTYLLTFGGCVYVLLAIVNHSDD